MESFGKYLLRKLKEKGLSQSQLAYYSRISDAHVSRLSKEERGLPKISTLIRICGALKISLNQMLRELGYISPKEETLPESLRIFLHSDDKPEDITTDEIEMLASFSFYEGEKTTPEGYGKLLDEQRDRPANRISSILSGQRLKVQEECAKMVETYVRLFGER